MSSNLCCRLELVPHCEKKRSTSPPEVGCAVKHARWTIKQILRNIAEVCGKLRAIAGHCTPQSTTPPPDDAPQLTHVLPSHSTHRTRAPAPRQRRCTPRTRPRWHTTDACARQRPRARPRTTTAPGPSAARLPRRRAVRYRGRAFPPGSPPHPRAPGTPPEHTERPSALAKATAAGRTRDGQTFLHKQLRPLPAVEAAFLGLVRHLR